jgi:hypothetical protein
MVAPAGGTSCCLIAFFRFSARRLDAGELVGIDIDHASKVMDLTKIETEAVPVES